MTNILLFVSAFLFLSVGALSYAQEPPPRPAQPQDPKSEVTPVKLTGCLTKGNQAQAYSITDETSGEKVMFSGPAKLDSYLNQVVEVRGEIVEDGGKKVFQPHAVKSVSASCKSGKD